MQTHERKLLVVIVESAIEKQVIALAKRLGARGYTAIEVRGGGIGSEREGQWEADRTVEIQFVCTETVADQIAEKVLAGYAADFHVALYLSDVKVYRAERY